MANRVVKISEVGSGTAVVEKEKFDTELEPTSSKKLLLAPDEKPTYASEKFCGNDTKSKNSFDPKDPDRRAASLLELAS